MKIKHLTMVLAGLLVASPALANQYRVQNWTYGWYQMDTSYTSVLFGLDADGNLKSAYYQDAIGNLWTSGLPTYNQGNTSGSVPAALSHQGTWTGDPARGLNDVDYDLYAHTTWGSNHARASFDNYQQVSTNTTSYYIPSDAEGAPIPGFSPIQIDKQTNSSLYGNANSQWEELYMIGGSPFSALGHYNATFHVDGKLGPSLNSDGTGNASMSWSLRDFEGQNLVSINAGYDASSDSWYKQTYSAGAWDYQNGTGELTINEDLQQNGGTFYFGTALYLNSNLQAYVSGNGVSNFENTVEMTGFELPGGSSVYAMSGTNLGSYNIAFDSTGGGGGVLCNDLNCATSGGGGGTVIPAIPEPETYAMMLAGLALVGWSARRRRSA
ncbi:MAG: PEP-CTERM sorting domain-containing protein [Pseudomonadota bacterium]|nr:PEP-CTERM sorting domain-containing protein [Pseudomonadota bacterium]